jgi:hypothetical protein
MKRSRFNINLVLRSAMVATPLLFAVPAGAQAPPSKSEPNARPDIVQQERERQRDDLAVENQKGQRPSRPADTSQQPTDTKTAATVAHLDIWSAEVEKMGDE